VSHSLLFTCFASHHRNAAAYYFQRLREIIVDQLKLAFHEVFAGEIEINESYFGGARQDKQG